MAFINGNSSIVTDKLHYYMDPGSKQSYIGSGTSAGSTVGTIPMGTLGASNVFSSDNGPTHVEHVDINFFNSAGPFVNSKNTVKGSVNEGGLVYNLVSGSIDEGTIIHNSSAPIHYGLLYPQHGVAIFNAINFHHQFPNMLYLHIG